MSWFSRRRRRGEVATGRSPSQATEIVAGTTAREVVDLLGPPLDFMDLAGLLGQAPVAGAVPSSHKLWWLYLDVPGTDGDLSLALTNGRVTDVSPTPSGPTEHEWRQQIRNGWAERIVPQHVEKVRGEFPDQPTTRPAWRRLTGSAVLDFVLTRSSAGPGDDGRLGSNARRFGDLDVIVSIVDLAAPDLVRTYLPDGYFAEFTRLVNGHGLAGRTLDIAHLILCNPQVGAPTAHMLYLPSERGVQAVAPWDLLREDEKDNVGRPPG